MSKMLENKSEIKNSKRQKSNKGLRLHIKIFITPLLKSENGHDMGPLSLSSLQLPITTTWGSSADLILTGKAVCLRSLLVPHFLHSSSSSSFSALLPLLSPHTALQTPPSNLHITPSSCFPRLCLHVFERLHCASVCEEMFHISVSTLSCA